MIYEPAEHEALTDTVFDRDRARAFIVDTVRTIDGIYDPNDAWRLHPEDDYGQEKGATNLGIYYGAAGTMWAPHPASREIRSHASQRL